MRSKRKWKIDCLNSDSSDFCDYSDYQKWYEPKIHYYSDGYMDDAEQKSVESDESDKSEFRQWDKLSEPWFTWLKDLQDFSVRCWVKGNGGLTVWTLICLISVITLIIKNDINRKFIMIQIVIRMIQRRNQMNQTNQSSDKWINCLNSDLSDFCDYSDYQKWY